MSKKLNATEDPKLRAAALAKANEVRAEVKDYLAQIASGEVAAAQAVVRCKLPVRVERILKAQKGWGEKKTAEALRRANVPASAYMAEKNSSTRVITDDERRRICLVMAGGVGVKSCHQVTGNRLDPAEVRRRMIAAGCGSQQIKQVVGL